MNGNLFRMIVSIPKCQKYIIFAIMICRNGRSGMQHKKFGNIQVERSEDVTPETRSRPSEAVYRPLVVR